jgi:hypothetical protein
MNELVVIGEGETEQTFVRDQLAGHLALHGVSVWGVLPGRYRSSGGVRKWEAARQDIIRTLREGRYCTTMMDYYAMPEDWPGRVHAKGRPWQERAAVVESQIASEVQQFMGDKFNPKFFIPYVQLHEFEALAFAEVSQLASVVAPLCGRSAESLQTAFSEIVAEAGHPEAINDGYATCPSRRIATIVPAYRKRVHGPIVTRRIGLEVLRSRCSHFASWLARLENIGAE